MTDTTPMGAAWLVRRAALFLAGAVLAGAACEGAARLLAPDQQRDSCAIEGRLGAFRPDCTSAPMKLAEGPWLQDRTNECGYRTAESCRSRPANGIRVAVIGTSMARGHFVPYPESWAGRATVALTAACRRPVEFQNLALARATDHGKPVWRQMTGALPAALALQPDALLTVMSPADIGFYPPGSDGAAAARPAEAPPAPPPSLRRRLGKLRSDLLIESRAAMLAKDALYRDPTAYAAQYLEHGDDADHVRSPLSPAWQARLRIAHAAFADMAAAAQGRPWAVVLVPGYGSAAVAQLGKRPGLDTAQLGRALGDDVRALGGHFIDLTGDFAADRQLSSLYYIADGHPNARGSAIIADRMADFLHRELPPFAGCAAP